MGSVNSIEIFDSQFLCHQRHNTDAILEYKRTRHNIESGSDSDHEGMSPASSSSGLPGCDHLIVQSQIETTTLVSGSKSMLIPIHTSSQIRTYLSQYYDDAHPSHSKTVAQKLYKAEAGTAHSDDDFDADMAWTDEAAMHSKKR